ncbi:vWA domain-containing protein [Deinococcus aquiradiocola]|uniref:VWA domain-containing protein n=1 Tax=Deinococcus aquiradiocola TaxID=393059 RepID=A0A917PPJ1_9DEIO|nr:VWA domain-containing protein [Deinococcus aquiradiocola]GGJ86035.1 VWA domain-containing protein [Deinococcus aquiradiocola]
MPDLSASMSEFVRTLRALGLKVGPGETADALRAMTLLDTLDPVQMQDALRALLTAHRHEAPIFDEAFRDHFLRRGAGDADLQPLGVQKPGTQPPGPPEERGQDADPRDGDGSGEQTPVRRQQPGSADSQDDQDAGRQLRSQLSPHAARQDADEGHAGNLDDLLAAATALVREVQLGRSRRWTPRPTGTRFDFRRTLRASLRTGGDPAHPRYQGHPRRSPRFLIVLDGSRSMAPHATLLLRYAAALMLRTRRVEVYSFSTGLTRLTPTLRHSLTRGTLWTVRLPDLGEGWGGGTRIGDNLLKLTRDERAHLTPDTITLILSDGLDTGEPQVLTRAVRELARQSGRLVWLNPLAGIPGYLPVARGMAAALPYLDVFAPADDAQALAALPARLRRARH